HYYTRLLAWRVGQRLREVGHVESGQVSLGDATIESRVDESGDAPEETLPSHPVQLPVPRESIQETEIARGIVDQVPSVSAGRYPTKQARVLDLALHRLWSLLA